MTGWKVVVDLDLCQAHQMCQPEAPEVFGFDRAADKVVVLDERPPAERRAGADRAVVYCPAMAITVVDHPVEED